MAQQFWATKRPHRERKERIIKVDGHDVLKEDNYTMQEGGISVAQEGQHQPPPIRHHVPAPMPR